MTAGVATTGIRAGWLAGAWRSTVHTVCGLLIVAGGWTFAGLVALFWYAAVWSLQDGPTGPAYLPPIYVVEALFGLLPLLWWRRALTDLHRIRFHTVLGIEITPAPRPSGRLVARLGAAIRTPGTWRELAYHVLSLITAPIAAAAVLACWAAVPVLAFAPDVVGLPSRSLPGRIALAGLAVVLLLAAPVVARAVTAVDRGLATRLLGPSENLLLRQRVESLTHSRAELVAAADAERRRIERDLHDGAQQRLVSLAMNLGMAREHLTDLSPEAKLAIADAHDEAVTALAELRELVRGLHPAVLDDRGLDAALSGIAARAPIPINLKVIVPKRCAPAIEAIAYFTVSEALANITRHAHAGKARVTVVRTGDRLGITVTDDGRGGATLESAGTGLRGLAQRAAAVDGTLRLHSPPGGPTTITVELPCES